MVFIDFVGLALKGLTLNELATSRKNNNNSTFRWKFVAPMITHRRCTCAVANGNFVFVIGGHDGAQILNTVETYDVERYAK